MNLNSWGGAAPRLPFARQHAVVSAACEQVGQLLAEPMRVGGFDLRGKATVLGWPGEVAVRLV